MKRRIGNEDMGVSVKVHWDVALIKSDIVDLKLR